MRLDDLTEEELKELEKYDDDYKNESIFKKIANIFKKKKTVDTCEEYDDIPPVKETFREKLSNRIGKAKATRQAKKDLKKSKKKEKKSLKDRFNEFKAKRKEKKSTKKSINKEFIKSLALTVFSGTLNLLSIGAMFVAASTATSIGIVPAILISGLFVGTAAITHCVFEDEFDHFVELNEQRKSAKALEESDIDFEEVDSDELVDEDIYEEEDNLSEDIEYEDVKDSYELEDSDHLNYREIKDEPIDFEEIKSVSDVSTDSEEKVLKTKLTREEKIGKIKEFGIGHDSRLGIYCVPVPKEEKTLQRFIREEYKKEYPEEKIQSFDTEKEKVMVFQNKPSMFRK